MPTFILFSGLIMLILFLTYPKAMGVICLILGILFCAAMIHPIALLVILIGICLIAILAILETR